MKTHHSLHHMKKNNNNKMKTLFLLQLLLPLKKEMAQIQFTREALHSVECATMIHNGSSQAAACHSLNVHEKQVIEWKKQFQALKHSSNKKAKSLCKGRSSILIPLTDPLLSFIFELCETGMAVSINMIVLKAAHLS